MSTMLQRKNILKIEIFYNILDNYKRYDKDNLISDLEITSFLVREESTSGIIKVDKNVISKGLIITNYYYTCELTQETYFIFSKKRIKYFKDGQMNGVSIYYKQKYVLN